MTFLFYALLFLMLLLGLVFGILQIKIASARKVVKSHTPPENSWLTGHYPTRMMGGIRQWSDWNVKYQTTILFCRIYFTPLLFISEFNAIKHILNNEDNFSKGYIYRPYKLWFARGLTPTEGEEARQTRKKLAPAFSNTRLQPFVPLFNRLATLLFDTRWRNNHDNNNNLPTGALKVNLFEDLRLLAFDSIGTCSGLCLNSLCGESPKALAAFMTIWDNLASQRLQNAKNPIFRFVSKYILPDGRKFYQAILYLQALADQAIRDRKAREAEFNDHEVHDLLYHLMVQTDFEEIKVRDLIINFLFAGSDIVGAMMAWTLLLLAKNEKIQEEVVKELKAACPNKDYILETEASKVPLLLACIKEAMRLFPPVPMLSRRVEKPFTVHIQEKDKKAEDLELEVGMEVFLNFWHAQKEGTWDRPLEFDPTRFLRTSVTIAKDSEKQADSADSADSADKISGAFCPFSLGRRNCIGQTFALTQGIVVVSRVLLRYHVSLPQDVDLSALPLIFSSAMQPLNPVWFSLQPRS